MILLNSCSNFLGFAVDPRQPTAVTTCAASLFVGRSFAGQSPSRPEEHATERLRDSDLKEESLCLTRVQGLGSMLGLTV